MGMVSAPVIPPLTSWSRGHGSLSLAWLAESTGQFAVLQVSLQSKLGMGMKVAVGSSEARDSWHW